MSEMTKDELLALKQTAARQYQPFMKLSDWQKIDEMARRDCPGCEAFRDYIEKMLQERLRRYES